MSLPLISGSYIKETLLINILCTRLGLDLKTKAMLMEYSLRKWREMENVFFSGS
jgi:hypothetical protein